MRTLNLFSTFGDSDNIFIIIVFLTQPLLAGNPDR